MKLFVTAAVLAIASFAPSILQASEATVRLMIQQRLGQSSQIESVRKAPFAGLYEVVIRGARGTRILYADREAKVIISGQVMDARSGENLTEARLRQLDAIPWAKLPLQWSFSTVRGTGRRKIAILSDPNCPYCKQFEEALDLVDDITVHILPFAVIKPDSVRLAKAVWCSKDRAKAWNELMFRRIEPSASGDCDTPIEKVIEFGARIGATSTPTWFVETGERYQGALPMDKVLELLDAASPGKRR